MNRTIEFVAASNGRLDELLLENAGDIIIVN